MKKHVSPKKSKRTSTKKFLIIIVSVLLAFFVLASIFSPSASEVKGVQTYQPQESQQQERGFFQRISAFFFSLFGHEDAASVQSQTSTTTPTSDMLDLAKLPLGDDKYTTSPKVGYVYSCQTTFNGGGAFTQGPWIDASAGTWDLTKKVQVDGDVSWPNAQFTLSHNGTSRILTGNDLPIDHTTGIYPIQQTDEAYNYDRNPNSIKAQNMTLTLPSNPTLLTTPQCVGGEVGIALTGVLIFNAFDAGGRDAVAMEVQDHCQGHPQAGGYYHYHGYSDCFEDATRDSEHSELVGYALDGFGIYGLKGEQGIELSTNDLDVCHGHTHSVVWDGNDKEIYHYHMTQDFPYTVGCFRGEPVVRGLSVGEGMGDQQRMQGQQRGLDPQKQGRPSFRGQ